jgi:hypothetical protein
MMEVVAGAAMDWIPVVRHPARESDRETDQLTLSPWVVRGRKLGAGCHDTCIHG